MRRIKLEPEEDALRKEINKWRMDQGFAVRYRTQDGVTGVESDFRLGRLEVFQQGFYVNLSEVPSRAYVDVEGVLNGQTKFSSGWTSADAVSIKI